MLIPVFSGDPSEYSTIEIFHRQLSWLPVFMFSIITIPIIKELYNVINTRYTWKLKPVRKISNEQKSHWCIRCFTCQCFKRKTSKNDEDEKNDDD